MPSDKLKPDEITSQPPAADSDAGGTNANSGNRLILLALGALAIVLAVALGILIFRFQDARAGAMAAAFDAASTQSLEAVASLDQSLTAAKSLAEALAEQLGSGALPPDAAAEGLRQALEANPEVDGFSIGYAPFSLDPGLRLHFISVYRDAQQQIVVEEGEPPFDYTQPAPGGKHEAGVGWYSNRVLHGPSWSDPFFDPETGQTLIQYGTPFYHTDKTTGEKTLAGVLTEDFAASKMQALVADLDLGQTGFGAVYAQSGVWLAHPVAERVATQTIFDSEPLQQDPAFLAATEGALQGEAQALTRFDALSNETVWNFFAPIESAGWSLLVQLSPAEYLPDPQATLQELAIILLLGGLVLALAIALLLRVDRLQPGRLWALSLSVSVIGLLIIVTLIVLSRQTPESGGVTVVNQTALDSYLENVGDEFDARGMQPPLEIPTGVLVQSARFPDGGSVVINGYIWQRVPKIEGQPIAAGFTLPQMIDEPFQTEEIMREEGENETLIVWSVIAALRQVFDPLEYPFDRHNISIRLAPTQLEPFALLTPDLGSYDVTTPGFLPGLDSGVRINDWDILSSSYRFVRHSSNTNLGIPGRPTVDAPELSYNIVAHRRFLGPFIAFLLPALVGAAMIFAFLLYDTKPDEPEEIVTALSYTAALFFVIAVMHTALRDDAAAIGLTYLEYFYMLLYVMVVFVAVNTFLVVKRPNARVIRYHNNLITKLLYWPVVVMVMLAATLAIFVF